MSLKDIIELLRYNHHPDNNTTYIMDAYSSCGLIYDRYIASTAYRGRSLFSIHINPIFLLIFAIALLIWSSQFMRSFMISPSCRYEWTCSSITPFIDRSGCGLSTENISPYTCFFLG